MASFPAPRDRWGPGQSKGLAQTKSRRGPGLHKPSPIRPHGLRDAGAIREGILSSEDDYVSQKPGKTFQSPGKTFQATGFGGAGDGIPVPKRPDEVALQAQQAGNTGPPLVTNLYGFAHRQQPSGGARFDRPAQYAKAKRAVDTVVSKSTRLTVPPLKKQCLDDGLSRVSLAMAQKRAKPVLPSLPTMRPGLGYGSPHAVSPQYQFDNYNPDALEVDRFIASLAKSDELEFVYVTRKNPQQSRGTCPYNVKIINHRDISPQDYCSLSKKGLTWFYRGDSYFTELDDWVQARKSYYGMMNIPFFKNYKKWRALYVLRKCLREVELENIRARLSSRLFVHNDIFKRFVYDTRRRCLEMEELEFYDIAGYPQTISEYCRSQENCRKRRLETIETVVGKIKNNLAFVAKAYIEHNTNVEEEDASLLEKGLQDYEAMVTRKKKEKKNPRSGYETPPSPRRIALNSPHLWEHCRQIIRLIRLVDFWLLDTKVASCMQSIKRMADLMQKLCDGSAEAGPSFEAKVSFEDSQLRLDPTNEQFESHIKQVLQDLLKDSTSPDFLVLDPTFQCYVDQVAVVDGTPRPGLDAKAVVERDKVYTHYKDTIRTCCDQGYERLRLLVKQHEPFMDMYSTNALLNAENIQLMPEGKPMLEWFQGEMDKYKKQQDVVDAMVTTHTMCMFSALTENLKVLLVPSPKRCLGLYHLTLPMLFASRNKVFFDEIKGAVDKLSAEPSNVDHYVDIFNLHTHMSQRLEPLDIEFTLLKDFHALLDTERIELSRNEHLNFVCDSHDCFDKLKKLIQSIEIDKGANILRFERDIAKSCEGYYTRLLQLQKKSENSMLTNVDADFVLEFIANLVSEVEELERDIVHSQENQALFGLNVTELPALATLSNYLSSQRLLWDTLKWWGEFTKAYLEIEFPELDLGILAMNINKCDRSMARVERSLGTSPVYHKLVESLDDFREILAVAETLKNPQLQPHHILDIDKIVGQTLADLSTYSLATLLELGVVRFREAIEGVGQSATHEKNLRDLFEHVRSLWTRTTTDGDQEPMEFDVLPYKNHKDVHVLGSVEGILNQIEDSLITLSTVITSRYCTQDLRSTAIKWQEDIKYIHKTLEKWLKVQRLWIYLEKPFSSAEMIRQHANNAKSFAGVSKFWKGLMQRTYEIANVYRAIKQPSLLDKLSSADRQLEVLANEFRQSLEQKRNNFPRFFFLSNDDLLEILSETSVEGLQQHIGKMFGAVQSMEHSDVEQEVTGIVSHGGERLKLQKARKIRGDIEKWFIWFEANMRSTLRGLAAKAVTSYEGKSRKEWIMEHPQQLVLTVASIFWCQHVTKALDSKKQSQELKGIQKAMQGEISELVDLIRADPSVAAGTRTRLSTQICLDIHHQNVIDQLLQQDVQETTGFAWQRHLRVYWREEAKPEGIYFIQHGQELHYGYEYQGCHGRLVITPLTERVYATTIQAMGANLGTVCAGASCTGKTEIIRDMAQALAIRCVVFPCSPFTILHTIENLFCGLVQCGGWCCLDGIEHLATPSLSIIASQLAEIRGALDLQAPYFTFQGRTKTPISPSFGYLATLGTSSKRLVDLPDNLTCLLRPVAMMVPDARAIAQTLLFANGFGEAHTHANKLQALVKSASNYCQSESLVGFRMLKDICMSAVNLRTTHPEASEISLLNRACKIILARTFEGGPTRLDEIVNDFMPDNDRILENPSRMDKDPKFVISLEEALEAQGLQSTPGLWDRMYQLHESITASLGSGVLLIGAAGCGKSTTREVVSIAMEAVNHSEIREFTIYPESVTHAELYGCTDQTSGEWIDGLCTLLLVQCASLPHPNMPWIVMDGTLGADWTRSLESAFDSDRQLFLDNGVLLSIPKSVCFIFEATDLSGCSPTLLSRCGVVCMDQNDVSWQSLVKGWCASMPGGVGDQVVKFFDQTFPDGLKFVSSCSTSEVAHVPLQLVQRFCGLFSAVIEAEGVDLTAPEFGRETPTVNLVFAWCFVWGLGGSLDTTASLSFDTFARNILSPVAKMPSKGTVFDYKIDINSRIFQLWEEGPIPEPERIDHDRMGATNLTPTPHTIRYTYLLGTLITGQCPVLLTGPRGSGKTIMTSTALRTMGRSMPDFHAHTLYFTLFTSSKDAQAMIETCFPGRKSGTLAPIPGKTMVLFIDDINLPRPDARGKRASQLELLRGLMEGSCYDRSSLAPRAVHDVNFIASSSGPMTQALTVHRRLFRRFQVLWVPELEYPNMRMIARPLLQSVLSSFEDDIWAMADKLLGASLDALKFATETFKPEPTHINYHYSMADLVSIVRGLSYINGSLCHKPEHMTRLWINETTRALSDRLDSSTNGTTHCSAFWDGLLRIAKEHFSLEANPHQLPLCFAHIRNLSGYKDFGDMPHLREKAQALLDMENDSSEFMLRAPFKALSLWDCEQVCRLTRLLGRPGGHVALTGMGLRDQQKLCRIAAILRGVECLELPSTDTPALLSTLYKTTGMDFEDCVLMVGPSELQDPSMLEMLMDLMVRRVYPPLLPVELKEQGINTCLDRALKAGMRDSRDALLDFFLEEVCTHTHVVLCLGIEQELLATLSQGFPSLFACLATISLHRWTDEALLGLAQITLDPASSLGSTFTEDVASKVHAAALAIHRHVDAVALKCAPAYSKGSGPEASMREFLKVFVAMLVRRECATSKRVKQFKAAQEKYDEIKALVQSLKSELNEVEQEQDGQGSLGNPIGEVDLKPLKAKVQQAKAEWMQAQHAADDKDQVMNNLWSEMKQSMDSASGEVQSSISELGEITKEELFQVRLRYTEAPAAAMFTLSAALALLREPNMDADAAFEVVEDPSFVSRLQSVSKDTISTSVGEKLHKFSSDKQFQDLNLAKVAGNACKVICNWAKAMSHYYAVTVKYQPQTQAYSGGMDHLKKLKDTARQLEEVYKEAFEKCKQAEDAARSAATNQANTEAKKKSLSEKLVQANQLLGPLDGEIKRMTLVMGELDCIGQTLVGDTLIAAAAYAYLGMLDTSSRKDSIKEWRDIATNCGLEVSSTLPLVETLSSPSQRMEWGSLDLPLEDECLTNGAMVALSTSLTFSRWPLMLDPQGIATAWVSKLETRNSLKVLSAHQPHYMATLTSAISKGTPILLKDVGGCPDPLLDPLLHREVLESPQGPVIKMGPEGKTIPWDASFRLYMVSSTGSLSPEAYAKALVINFSPTEKALQEDLLKDIIAIRNPSLEEDRHRSLRGLADDEKRLRQCEDTLMAQLAGVQGAFPEDIGTLDTLKKSLYTTSLIAKRLPDEQEKLKIAGESRDTYRPFVDQLVRLYEVVNKLPSLSPLYRHSFNQVKVIFTTAYTATVQALENITGLEVKGPQQAEIATLVRQMARCLYKKVSQGLSHSHKFVFALLLIAEVKRIEGAFSEEWELLTSSSGLLTVDTSAACPVSPTGIPPRPYSPAMGCPIDWIDPNQWALLQALNQMAAFKGLLEGITADPKGWQLWAESPNYTQPCPNGFQIQGNASSHGTTLGTVLKSISESEGMRTERSFDAPKPDSRNLLEFSLLCRACRPRHLMQAIHDLVVAELGLEEEWSHPTPLHSIVPGTTSTSPILYILNPGSNYHPAREIQRAARHNAHTSPLRVISLGLDQDERARKMVAQARRGGDWAIIENCHLFPSFLPGLEHLLKTSDPGETLEQRTLSGQFRLWLTCCPDFDAFPQSLMELAITVANDPPVGVLWTHEKEGTPSPTKKDTPSPTKEGTPSPTKEDTHTPTKVKAPSKASSPAKRSKKAKWGAAVVARMAIATLNSEGIVSTKEKGSPTLLRPDIMQWLHGFHAMVCQPWNHDPLTDGGWGVWYGFTMEDLSSALLWTSASLQQHESLSWDMLCDVITNTYGGRVTDSWALEMLPILLATSKKYCYPNPKLDFAIPDFTPYHIRHTSASDSILKVYSSLNSFSVRNSIGFPTPDIKLGITRVRALVEALPPPLRVVAPQTAYGTATTAAIMAEGASYNNILTAITTVLESLIQALEGHHIFSQSLVEAFLAICQDEVPGPWCKLANPCRSLELWSGMVVHGVETIRALLVKRTSPAAISLSAFLNPGGFLDGILHDYAEKQGMLNGECDMMCHLVHPIPEGPLKPPAEGLYVTGVLVDGLGLGPSPFAISRSGQPSNVSKNSYLSDGHGQLLSPMPLNASGSPPMDSFNSTSVLSSLSGESNPRTSSHPLDLPLFHLIPEARSAIPEGHHPLPIYSISSCPNPGMQSGSGIHRLQSPGYRTRDLVHVWRIGQGSRVGDAKGSKEECSSVEGFSGGNMPIALAGATIYMP